MGGISSHLRAGKSGLRRSTRSSIVRLGGEEQARKLQGRLREARSAFDGGLRRELRDDHAMRVVLAAVLHGDSNAIDVGANEGGVLEPIVHIAPSGRHIAYEPIPELCKRLVDRFPSVDVRQAALYDSPGTVSFTHNLDRPTVSGLRQRGDVDASSDALRHFSVRTERLDDVLERDYVPTLIKIDVEGAELGVLRGAVETLHRHRPHVLFEHGIGGADLYDARPTELFDLLDESGLRIFDLDGVGPYSRERFEATFSEPIWNFLAAPG
jgi:FkbM family methyltransferase